MIVYHAELTVLRFASGIVATCQLIPKSKPLLLRSAPSMNNLCWVWFFLDSHSWLFYTVWIIYILLMHRYYFLKLFHCTNHYKSFWLIVKLLHKFPLLHLIGYFVFFTSINFVSVWSIQLLTVCNYYVSYVSCLFSLLSFLSLSYPFIAKTPSRKNISLFLFDASRSQRSVSGFYLFFINCLLYLALVVIKEIVG